MQGERGGRGRETKGMTGLSAPLAVDFDLCVRPGPDACSCYVYVCICVCACVVGANTSDDVCLRPHPNTHLFCHLTDQHPHLRLTTLCYKITFDIRMCQERSVKWQHAWLGACVAL